MDGHADRVFARDWFIESGRLLSGIVNKGKLPVHRMGFLQWERTETVSVFITQMGGRRWGQRWGQAKTIDTLYSEDHCDTDLKCQLSTPDPNVAQCRSGYCAGVVGL